MTSMGKATATTATIQSFMAKDGVWMFLMPTHQIRNHKKQNSSLLDTVTRRGISGEITLRRDSARNRHNYGYKGGEPPRQADSFGQ
jgi:hypothetical protein